MSRIFWDTNLFIYLLKDYPDLCDRVIGLRQRMLARNDQLYTSVLTLGELLVKPMEAGDEGLQRRYRELLTAGTVLLPFDESAAVRYAEIRLDRGIKPPDAIQLACASTAGIDMFITNDDRLGQRIVPGIQFVASLQRAWL